MKTTLKLIHKELAAFLKTDDSKPVYEIEEGNDLEEEVVTRSEYANSSKSGGDSSDEKLSDGEILSQKYYTGKDKQRNAKK